MVGTRGLEPPTSRSRTVRSSQLSYVPNGEMVARSYLKTSPPTRRGLKTAMPYGCSQGYSVLPFDCVVRRGTTFGRSTGSRRRKTGSGCCGKITLNTCSGFSFCITARASCMLLFWGSFAEAGVATSATIRRRKQKNKHVRMSVTSLHVERNSFSKLTLSQSVF